MNPEKIITGYKNAKDARAVVESTWEDIVYYTIPRKRGITTKIVPGDKTPADIYNATPQYANVILAAGLAGFLTNASQLWFEMGPRNMALMDNSDEKRWFSDVTRILFSTFADSNFYNQAHEMYLDFGPMGTGVMQEEEDELQDVRFHTRHPRECYFMENARGTVDMMYRCFEWTAYEAIDFFSRENLPGDIVKAFDDDRDFETKFKFLHYVGPRSIRDPRLKNKINKPFMSVWLHLDTPDRILREGGFDEFPFFVPRFYKNPGEPYGYGPGHIVFPDIRMLNEATKLYYQASETSLFPPTIEEHDSIIGTLDMRAKARNHQRQSLSRGLAVQPIDTGTKYQIALDFLDRLEEKVERAFFVDLFLALRQTKRMTATEVMEISQERMFMLGPVLGRLQHEFLDPLIVRTFNILLRRGKLPTPPASLQGVDYEIKYISPLARAQRAIQARDTQAFMAIIAQMSQMLPEVLDKMNADEAVDALQEMYSIDPNIVYGPEEVAEIRKQRAELQAQQQQMMVMQQGAAIAKDASKASKDFAESQRSAS